MAESTVPAQATSEVMAGPAWHRCGTLKYTQLGLVMVFVWLLWGDFTFALMEAVIPTILPLKLKELSASNFVMSIILTTIPNTCNFFINPVVSFRSDRHRGRWGRRIPFLLFPTPFITVTLVAMAFVPEIGTWIHIHLVAPYGIAGRTAVIIGTIGVIMAFFEVFNMFISSVYYYLFNDVVPSPYISRFMASFRFMGGLAGMTYNFLIFPHALTHTRQIFLGAAALYLVGFLTMCWRLKEGQYPPPPPLVGRRKGVLASAQTYFKECFTHPFYLKMFAFSASLWVASSCSFVATLFYLHLGISLKQIGTFHAIMTIPGLALVIPIGWLADRWHPVRVVTWSLMWFPLLSVASFFFIHDFRTMVILTLIGFPINTFYWVAVLPMNMMLFPKERYGQFGSADAMARASSRIVCSLLAGVFLDFMRRLYHGNEEYYRWMYIWAAVCQVSACFFMWLVYADWKRYGGRDHYHPPAVGPASGAVDQ